MSPSFFLTPLNKRWRQQTEPKTDRLSFLFPCYLMDPSPQPKYRSRPSGDGARPASVRRPTSVASILRPSPDDEDDDGGGEGPYFDLEFSIPEEANSVSSDSYSNSDDDISDDLFFHGHSSLRFTPSSKPHFPSSLLKSATKFRVFMLRFKKPRPPHLEHPQSSPSKPKQNNNGKINNKKFLVKFKVEEVPIVSLFTRDRSSSSARSAKLYAEESMHSPAASASDDKRQHPKDVIHKYLNKIMPLYDRRASKRFSSGHLTAGGDQEKSSHSSFSASGLRIVSRRLRKSRSASAAVAAVRSPPRRKDDSLIEKEDGIQSAIAHCKRSFNAGKGSDVGPGSDLGLSRSRSDPGAERRD